MNPSPLTALSPLDGRYHGKVSALRPYFSEYALIRYRVQIEIEWFKALSQEPEISEVSAFSAKVVEYLDDLVTNFSEADAEAVKAIESRTNHDVKAIEYWLKQRLMENAEIIAPLEFIHFACTSEDINNLSHGLMLLHSRDRVMLPALENIITRLCDMAHQLATTPMLARTHGQPATPTTLGKELANFIYRQATPFLLHAMNHYAWFPLHIPTLKKFGALDRRSPRLRPRPTCRPSSSAHLRPSPRARPMSLRSSARPSRPSSTGRPPPAAKPRPAARVPLPSVLRLSCETSQSPST